MAESLQLKVWKIAYVAGHFKCKVLKIDIKGKKVECYVYEGVPMQMEKPIFTYNLSYVKPCKITK